MLFPQSRNHFCSCHPHITTHLLNSYASVTTQLQHHLLGLLQADSVLLALLEHINPVIMMCLCDSLHLWTSFQVREWCFIYLYILSSQHSGWHKTNTKQSDMIVRWIQEWVPLSKTRTTGACTNNLHTPSLRHTWAETVKRRIQKGNSTEQNLMPAEAWELK